MSFDNKYAYYNSADGEIVGVEKSESTTEPEGNPIFVHESTTYESIEVTDSDLSSLGISEENFLDLSFMQASYKVQDGEIVSKS